VRTSVKETGSVRTAFGWLSHQQPQEETVKVRASETEVDRRVPVRSGRGQGESQGPDVVARGVIRREEVPLLARYGTSYALFDEWIADYDCVLKSDAYRLGEYVGDDVWISGPLSGVI
jgi:hypothetical protein